MATVQAMKQQAAAMLRAGQRDAALAKLKEAKALEAELHEAAAKAAAGVDALLSDDMNFDDDGDDLDVDVTDDDLNDPSLMAELGDMDSDDDDDDGDNGDNDTKEGKSDAGDEGGANSDGKTSGGDTQSQIQRLAQQAIKLRAAGDTAGAMELLHRIKALKQEQQASDGKQGDATPAAAAASPASQGPIEIPSLQFVPVDTLNRTCARTGGCSTHPFSRCGPQSSRSALRS